jgi:hypothetical protein
LTDAIDALYALPLEVFTAERDALAKRLRKDKDRDGANAVAKLRKPTAAAWMLNQVAREEPEAVTALLEATEALRQATGSGEGVREAITAHRDASRAVLALAREQHPNGKPATDAVVDRIRDVLAAVALDEGLAEALRAGRLAAGEGEADAGPDSAFGQEAAPAKAAPPRRGRAAKAAALRRDRQADRAAKDEAATAGGKTATSARRSDRAAAAAKARKAQEEEAARRREALEQHLAEAAERLAAAQAARGRRTRPRPPPTSASKRPSARFPGRRRNAKRREPPPRTPTRPSMPPSARPSRSAAPCAADPGGSPSAPVEPHALRGRRARRRIEAHEVGRQRAEPRALLVHHAGDPEVGRRVREVARATRAGTARVEDGHAGLAPQRSPVRVAR